MDNKPTTAEIVIMASGALVLVASFLDFYGISSAWSHWSYLVAAVFGAAMAAQVALRVFAKTDTGSGVAGISWPTIHLVLGFYVAVLLVTTAIESTTGAEIGLWGMLIGGIGLLVGAVMLNQSSGAARPGPTA